ncbi:hypothetical protein G6F36_010796 [Rhizopus arrhizus]|nr:hypothetical protein G6F36_010796 [Rhizopus arrhizus]
MSNTELNEPSMTIYQDLSLNSNHKLISLSFEIASNIPQLSQHPRLTWHLGKLKDPNKRAIYLQRFRELSAPLLHYHKTHPSPSNFRTAITYIEKFNTDLCQAIYISLDDSCGRVTNPKDPTSDFWTKEMQAAFEYQELCYRKWRKAHGLNKLQYWLKHQEARAAVCRLITQRRRATWKDFCDRLATGDYDKAISKISRIRKNRTLKPAFSTPEGTQHAANTMVSHLESIFSGDQHGEVQCNNATLPNLPFTLDCPITTDDIVSAIRSLPVKKAPGVDHLRNEMLQPIQHLLTPILLVLFQMCWPWSYVPQLWRIAQVVPIHKKGKILERCIQDILQTEGPPLDIAQCFREPCSTLDQAICLSEICQILPSKYHVTPALAFLDIKSAYDAVNRNFVWETLSHYVSPPLLGLLRNIFDDIQVEVLLSNATSRRISPKTGVLQGSILSPYLYSVYINKLPAQLRPQALTPDMSPLEMIPSLNCLLYADDVVLIAESSNMVDLLQKCEIHSLQMGYKWNPSKCVILDNSTDPRTYTLYDQPLPRETTFAYLGVPFKPGGYLDSEELIQRNTHKALATMNMLSSIGVNPSGFSKLLCTRFYAHIVRPQLEYGLAINRFTVHQLHALEEAQNSCIRKIYGARGKASTKVMLHMSKLPSCRNESVYYKHRSSRLVSAMADYMLHTA